MLFAWQMWNLRNMWVFEKKRMEPIIVCEKMMCLLNEFEAVVNNERARDLRSYECGA